MNHFIGRLTKFVSDGSDFVFGKPITKRLIQREVAKTFCLKFLNTPEERKSYENILSEELTKNEILRIGWEKSRKKLGSETHPEFLALYTYTLEDPQVYSDFNRQTRELGPLHKSYNYKAFYYFISMGMNKISPKPFSRTVYRGVTYPVSAEVGSKFTFNCFTSTSELRSVAESFLGGKNPKTLFIIETNRGADISTYSKFPDEEEVLISPCEMFDVIKINKENGIQEIYLRSSSMTA